jgi:hypothetical protein
VKIKSLSTLLVALFGATFSAGQSSILTLDVSQSTREPVVEKTNQVYRDFVARLNVWSSATRSLRASKGLSDGQTPYLMPAMVRLSKDGSYLPTGGRGRGNEITLDIDPSFNTTADPGRVAFLQGVYDNAKATIEAIYGDAAISGTVRVVNFDTQIGDRNAVTGGFYVPNNGNGVREIRLPLNPSREVAAVALIHCILLAYLPDPAYGFDAYFEGLARAATMRIVRIPAAVPGLDQEIVEQILENTYDVGPLYDWFNQKSLTAKRFIAPNLTSTPIAEGTLGGLYLTRYKMAGSAWQKVLAEYPSFIREFNTNFRANTSLANSASGLANLVGTSLPAGATTIEDIPVADWVRRQYVLQSVDVPGTKLHSQISPITSSLSGTDFGVFSVEATWFSTDASGNETLLSGTSYPIFWDRNYNRIIPSAQDERVDIAGSYGAVVPNFPNQNNNVPYRVAIDLPVQDRVVRSYVPAGAIATPTVTAPRDLYGTVVGFTPPTGGSLLIRVSFGSTTLPDIPVTDFAFGTLVGTSEYLQSRSLLVRVISKDSSNAETVVLTRRVNKGPGSLALDLGSAPTGNLSFPTGLSSGIQLIGFSGDPFAATMDGILGITPGNFLAARYNPGRAAYDLFPNTGLVSGGQGFFVRVGANSNPSIPARIETNTGIAVALRPGWNVVANPLGDSVPFTRVDVVRAANFPISFDEAIGNGGTAAVLGRNIFQFVPGLADPVTGFPEGGSFTATTAFAPGIGYFVRCLAPEGLTLLFRPATLRSNGRAVESPSNPAFRMKVTLGTKGAQSHAYIAQNPNATAGFDSFLDSNLPPSVGGMQLAVAAGNDHRYLDAQPNGGSRTYRLVLNNLIVGREYFLNATTEIGHVSSFSVVNISNGRGVTYGRRNGVYALIANSKTMFFDITVRGAR